MNSSVQIFSKLMQDESLVLSANALMLVNTFLFFKDQLFPPDNHFLSDSLQGRRKQEAHQQKQQREQTKLKAEYFYSFKDLATRQQQLLQTPKSHNNHRQLFRADNNPEIPIANLYATPQLLEQRFLYIKFVNLCQQQGHSQSHQDSSRQLKNSELLTDLRLLDLQIQRQLQEENNLQSTVPKRSRSKKSKLNEFLRRSQQWQQRKQMNIRKLKGELYNESYNQCSFTPKISKRSQELFRLRENRLEQIQEQQFTGLSPEPERLNSELAELQMQNKRLRKDRDLSWFNR